MSATDRARSAPSRAFSTARGNCGRRNTILSSTSSSETSRWRASASRARTASPWRATAPKCERAIPRSRPSTDVSEGRAPGWRNRPSSPLHPPPAQTGLEIALDLSQGADRNITRMDRYGRHAVPAPDSQVRTPPTGPQRAQLPEQLPKIACRHQLTSLVYLDAKCLGRLDAVSPSVGGRRLRMG